jgi:predicted dehydrogenase
MSESTPTQYHHLPQQIHTSEGKYRWGYLGTGGIAYKTAGDFKIAGINIAAVGSRHIDSAESFGKEYSVPRAHGSYEDLVNDPEVDIIYVNTLNQLHYENTLLALNAGKHVLLEKPFTLNAYQAIKLKEAAVRNNRFLMEAMWTRFLPSQVVIKNLINSGVIGKPHLVIADHTQNLPESNHRRLWDIEMGGGALLDLGIYCVSYATWMLGNTPSKVISSSIMSHTNVDQSDAIILEYLENGKVTAQASLTTSMMLSGSNVAHIFGSEGRMEIDSRFYNDTSFRTYNKAGELTGSFTQKIEGVGRQYQALEAERCLDAGLIESPVMDLESTIANMKILDQVRVNCSLKYPHEA